MKNEWIRTVKYLLFTASAGLIELGSFALMNELIGWGHWLSYLIALVLSVVWNFTFNRRFTFKSASNIPKAMLLVLAYYCVFTPLTTMLENYLTSTLLWNGYLATVINMLLNVCTEFPYQRFVVFRGTLDTNELAKKAAGSATK